MISSRRLTNSGMARSAVAAFDVTGFTQGYCRRWLETRKSGAQQLLPHSGTTSTAAVTASLSAFMVEKSDPFGGALGEGSGCITRFPLVSCDI
jgi:hypothetical protein